MRQRPVSLIFQLVLSATLLLLAACAPAPIYKNTAGVVIATPSQVAQAPENFSNSRVIWGGRIVQVSNFSDHSEVELLAYPLDSSQRPQANDSGNGRFIAIMQGYVEPIDYPAGALMTVSGSVKGTRAGKVGEANYVFPVVNVDQSHVWTADEMRKGRNNVHFGLGLGVGIH